MPRPRTIAPESSSSEEREAPAAGGADVSEGIVGLAASRGDADMGIDIDEQDLAEDDRRCAAIDSGDPTVPHEDVGRWLKAWGTPDFRPWREWAGINLPGWAKPKR